MHVVLVASTALAHGITDTEYPLSPDADVDAAGELIEFAGRNCYQSWDRPNPATASNADYIAHIIAQGHFSVLEHASATLYATGVSRALLAELTRHRHLSFSVLSQRFVDEHHRTDPVLPPAAVEHPPAALAALRAWRDAQDRYAEVVAALTAAGLPRKQVREAARSVLPQMTETRVVVTGNHRAWREVIAKRDSPHADAEIRAFARAALDALRPIAPAVYADLP